MDIKKELIILERYFHTAMDGSVKVAVLIYVFLCFYAAITLNGWFGYFLLILGEVTLAMFFLTIYPKWREKINDKCIEIEHCMGGRLEAGTCAGCLCFEKPSGVSTLGMDSGDTVIGIATDNVKEGDVVRFTTLYKVELDE